MSYDDDAEAVLSALAAILRAGISPTTPSWTRGLPAKLGGHIRTRLERGDTLAPVLAEVLELPGHERVLIEASERAGTVPDMLDGLVDGRRARKKLRRKMLVALIYPCLLLLAASVLLPLPTLVSAGGEAYAARAAPGVVVVVVLMVLLFGVLPRLPPSSPVRRLGGVLARRLPLVGPRLVYGPTAVFCEVLGRTVRAGVPITLGLPSALEATGDAAFVRAATPMRRALEAGASLDAALTEVKGLPGEVHRQIAVAEQVGTLDGALLALAAQARERHGQVVLFALVTTGGLVFALVALSMVAGIITTAQTHYFDRIDSIMEQMDGPEDS